MSFEWLEHHLLPCPVKHYFGIECPGCGMQRSIVELLKGNFAESFILYPPLIPNIILIILLIVNLYTNSEIALKILKYALISDAIIILVNYLLKII
ncbi:MAG: DUF2752 domain-containing protein [Bacteroidales bacterium]|nr:DUF2752 domain-containing protein [Bacteroidales bacterium]